MKKILKYLLVPIFITSTSLTVVACGTNQQVWNQDILNSAIGRMQDHIFNMKDDLNMEDLPADESKYSDLSLTVQSRISSYYSDLVKTGVNWDNPDVAVTIKANKNNDSFLSKYGNNVEARISLIAHLSYQNLNADTNIVVKINNDEESQQIKINAISDYLATYLDKSPVFYFETLFKDHLKSDDKSVRYLDFEAPLRASLFKETTEENPIPVIDVAGVDISVTGPETSTEIYTLDNPGIVTINETKVIQGKLSNLSLIIHNQSVNQVITGKTLTIAQKISDASTQITTMLNQGSQSLQFKQGTLPETTPGSRPPTLEDYFNGAGASLKTDVQTKLFDIINKFYPSANMSGTVDSWSSTQIAFPNASSSPFVKLDDTHGYFLANINFIVKIAADSLVTVDSLVYNIKLNLTKG